MEFTDAISQHYSPLLEGRYDCLDRLVLNGYCPLLHNGGGFRVWYRNLNGGDSDLDNQRLVRFSGRFKRRVEAFCKSSDIPFIHCGPGERKHELAEGLQPEDPGFEGLFAVFCARATAKLWNVLRLEGGKLILKRKEKQSFVNHFYFHIQDKEWGHLMIRICSHPPFSAQIVLNGHEWVERREEFKKLNVVKVGNCFTSYSDGGALSKVAEACKRKGQLEEVCNRWIYKCLWFALDGQEQERSGFRYQYSIYQVEYSRNLLFRSGSELDQMYQTLIDLTRRHLDPPKLKTLMGIHQRRHKPGSAPSGFEVCIERPDYNLTVFKVHFDRLTLKLYDKGERTLRSEVVVHNAKVLKCRRSLPYFQEIVSKLETVMLHFMNSLNYAHVSLIGAGKLEQLAAPTQRGEQRLAGINLANARMLAVLQTVLSLSLKPGGYCLKEVADKMSISLGREYSTRNASYDLRKLKGKGLVVKIPKSRRYQTTSKGAEKIIALLALLQKQLPMVLSGLESEHSRRPKKAQTVVDQLYFDTISSIQNLNQHYGIQKIAS